jgi:hypothetical protein
VKVRLNTQNLIVRKLLKEMTNLSLESKEKDIPFGLKKWDAYSGIVSAFLGVLLAAISIYLTDKISKSETKIKNMGELLEKQNIAIAKQDSLIELLSDIYIEGNKQNEKLEVLVSETNNVFDKTSDQLLVNSKALNISSEQYSMFSKMREFELRSNFFILNQLVNRLPDVKLKKFGEYIGINITTFTDDYNLNLLKTLTDSISNLLELGFKNAFLYHDSVCLNKWYSLYNVSVEISNEVKHIIDNPDLPMIAKIEHNRNLYRVYNNSLWEKYYLLQKYFLDYSSDKYFHKVRWRYAK